MPWSIESWLSATAFNIYEYGQSKRPLFSWGHKIRPRVKRICSIIRDSSIKLRQNNSLCLSTSNSANYAPWTASNHNWPKSPKALRSITLLNEWITVVLLKRSTYKFRLTIYFSALLVVILVLILGDSEALKTLVKLNGVAITVRIWQRWSIIRHTCHRLSLQTGYNNFILQ